MLGLGAKWEATEEWPDILDVTLTQFASVLDTPVPPIVLMPYSEAKSRYHLVDAEPLQESQECSTAFMRAVSDGSLLMAEMWRRISQAEIGFAWDAEQITAEAGHAAPGKRFEADTRYCCRNEEAGAIPPVAS
ncbi:MAG TPA: hypothetical protein VGK74_19015 [Symbiobacteriaceae bacterium]|jgi:hypothetical protein